MLITQLASIASAGTGLVYLHAYFCLYKLVKAEKPEWLSVQGSFSFLYAGRSSIGDPNVQTELLRIAFGSRFRQLRSPKAASYVRRIRLFGSSSFILFIVAVIGVLINVP